LVNIGKTASSAPKAVMQMSCGTNMSESGCDAYDADWCRGLHFGDPYGEVERVTRSVLSVPSMGSLAYRGVDPECYKVVDLIAESSFASADAPPPLPQHAFFQLASTTLYLKRVPSHKLGNCLLSFLRDQAALGVKVRRGKFTLKAEVLVNGSPCTVKLRVYAMRDGCLSVEVQRRTGDAVTFAVVYGMLVQHLTQHGYQMQELSFSPQAPLAPECKHQAFGSLAHVSLDNFVVGLA